MGLGSPGAVGSTERIELTESGTVDFGAGWSSPVARWAHNPKVAGSNPAPATNLREVRD